MSLRPIKLLEGAGAPRPCPAQRPFQPVGRVNYPRHLEAPYTSVHVAGSQRVVRYFQQAAVLYVRQQRATGAAITVACYRDSINRHPPNDTLQFDMLSSNSHNYSHQR